MLDTKRSRECKEEAEEKECRDKAVRSLLGDRTRSHLHEDTPTKRGRLSHICALPCAPVLLTEKKKLLSPSGYAHRAGLQDRPPAWGHTATGTQPQPGSAQAVTLS